MEMMGFKIEENEKNNPYKRGLTDALLGRKYEDGCFPAHDLIVFVPGEAFSNPAQARYRDGWLEGKFRLHVLRRDRLSLFETISVLIDTNTEILAAGN